MLGLGLADESLGPPELADGGTLAHITGHCLGGAVAPGTASAAADAAPFVVSVLGRIPRPRDASAVRRQRRTYHQTRTLLM